MKLHKKKICACRFVCRYSALLGRGDRRIGALSSSRGHDSDGHKRSWLAWKPVWTAWDLARVLVGNLGFVLCGVVLGSELLGCGGDRMTTGKGGWHDGGGLPRQKLLEWTGCSEARTCGGHGGVRAVRRPGRRGCPRRGGRASVTAATGLRAGRDGRGGRARATTGLQTGRDGGGGGVSAMTAGCDNPHG